VFRGSMRRAAIPPGSARRSPSRVQISAELTAPPRRIVLRPELSGWGGLRLTSRQEPLLDLSGDLMQPLLGLMCALASLLQLALQLADPRLYGLGCFRQGQCRRRAQYLLKARVRHLKIQRAGLALQILNRRFRSGERGARRCYGVATNSRLVSVPQFGQRQDGEAAGNPSPTVARCRGTLQPGASLLVARTQALRCCRLRRFEA
jgi:hypothetical protein